MVKSGNEDDKGSKIGFAKEPQGIHDITHHREPALNESGSFAKPTLHFPFIAPPLPDSREAKDPKASVYEEEVCDDDGRGSDDVGETSKIPKSAQYVFSSRCTNVYVSSRSPGDYASLTAQSRTSSCFVQSENESRNMSRPRSVLKKTKAATKSSFLHRMRRGIRRVFIQRSKVSCRGASSSQKVRFSTEQSVFTVERPDTIEEFGGDLDRSDSDESAAVYSWSSSIQSDDSHEEDGHVESLAYTNQDRFAVHE